MVRGGRERDSGGESEQRERERERKREREREERLKWFWVFKISNYSVSGFSQNFLFLNPSRIIVQKSSWVEQLIIQTLKSINIALVIVIS